MTKKCLKFKVEIILSKKETDSFFENTKISRKNLSVENLDGVIKKQLGKDSRVINFDFVGGK